MANNSTNNQNQASVINIENIVNVNDKKQSIFFEIPPYQRLYEWDKEQIQTLLNDIKTKFDEDKNKEYFIGNVVVSKKDDKNDHKYLLIDGQQRLTTLFLIGFFLSYKNCDNWQNFIINDNKLRISMSIREKEEKVLKEFAKFCEGSEGGERKNDIFLQEIKKFPRDICQNIPQALEIIANWFEENIKENIENFSNFIFDKVKFVFVELAQNTDLNRFFIRMNNRGKQLEKHEILKARLLSKFINEDESKRTLYAHIWDICSQMDNYIFQKASDRKISKLNESNGDENTIEKIIGNYQQKITKKDDDEDKSKFKSIVDFPTFLLHVYKICNKKDIAIDKNKLLEIIKIEEKEAKNFIENLLKYRILFDYFVIKSQDDMENSYKIRKLDKENKTCTISKDFDDLAMVQNYLRVARSGMSNNHHHWLTPFLKFLDKEIKLNFSFDELSDDKNIISEIQINDNINFYGFITNGKNIIQKNPISFLENLDTSLAKEQANTEVKEQAKEAEKNGEKKDLLEISNEVLVNLSNNDECIFTNTNEVKIPNLDQGTATPHYWFYRLEYYLWKNRENSHLGNYKLNDKNFSEIANNFYFRSLNSIEHVQAQSKAQEWKDNAGKIDNFGNLALISSSFNSSLNNQDVLSKYRDFQKRYIDGTEKAVISLKLWLIYALANKDGEDKISWTFDKAQDHKNQILEALENSFKSKQDKA
ncbi:DUF262 domain-containing protein [Campylobacter lari]|uniref:DUF262 domain-containing protein n=1 Tax=Campylobacter lari TaxID=201 RepID=UPI00057E6BEA|nr:DUF262 domain-containing protein [Campylobacter lari]AJD04889.1 hypothetical protein (DUF262, DUF1524 domains) [Campylobacter lari RM16701]